MQKRRVATELITIIDNMIERDQGAKFRQLLEPLLPKMEDAYRGEADRFRSHLGVSMIGKECARELWYGWKWVKPPKFSGQTLRLFNRGHLEEARFLAMLQMINCELWYETEEGGQFRISEIGGHYGSALDGIARNIPGLNPEDLAYTEFKTINEKGFKAVKKNGLYSEKKQHYTQMQVCMDKYDLPYGLYMVVNKNTDELYAEIIELDKPYSRSFDDRARYIIFTDEAPPRISENPTWYKCKFCDHNKICHGTEKPEINCRTCIHSTPLEDGTWRCEEAEKAGADSTINKELMLEGCSFHMYNPHLLNVQILSMHSDPDYIEIKLKNANTVLYGPDYIRSQELELT